MTFITQTNHELQKALKTLNITPVYKTINKFNCLIKLGKDKCKPEENANVVYKINCKDCNSSYVGQTSRNVTTRAKEHEADCRHHRNKTAILNHINDNRYAINFYNVKVLDNENILGKILLSEMLYITAQKKGMNIQKDTGKLKNEYKSFICANKFLV